MKTLAAYITALGPAERIEVGPLPVAAIGPTDVPVRTEALAVDQVDSCPGACDLRRSSTGPAPSAWRRPTIPAMSSASTSHSRAADVMPSNPADTPLDHLRSERSDDRRGRPSRRDPRFEP